MLQGTYLVLAVPGAGEGPLKEHILLRNGEDAHAPALSPLSRQRGQVAGSRGEQDEDVALASWCG